MRSLCAFPALSTTRLLTLLPILSALALVGCGAEPRTDGKLDEGDYSRLEITTERFEKEAGQFRDGVGKCSTIASAGQLAEASKCVSDAFDGWERAAGLAYTDYTDLMKVSGKTCRGSLVRLRGSMDSYFSGAKFVATEAENLRLDEFSAGVLEGKVDDRRSRYEKRRKAAYARCATG